MSNKFFTLLTLCRLTLAAAPAVTSTGDLPAWIPSPHRSWWPGWEGLQHLIVFGDSYTTTTFNISGDQPSQANPLGNPAFPGYTSSNGPNWIDFLTYTFNASAITTLNLAWGGATVDTDLIHGVFPTYSLKQQVEDWYLPNYTGRQRSFSWRPWDTLFTIFIGINDINYGYQYPQNVQADAFAKSIAEYSALVDKLYHSGARNFLFLNVPPIDECPQVRNNFPSASSIARPIIADWNANISHLAQNLSDTYNDAMTFMFDTHALYEEILDNPKSHAETAPIMNTTDACDFYAFGTGSDWYKKDSHCQYSVDEYFWLNSLHVGFRVQNATAAQVAKQLHTRQPWW